MAHGSGMEWSGRIKCSYKTATMLICAGNLVVALYVLHSLLTPLYIVTSSSLAGPANGAHNLFQAAKYTEDEVKRMREAIKVRQASQPVDLIRRVKEIGMGIIICWSSSSSGYVQWWMFHKLQSWRKQTWWWWCKEVILRWRHDFSLKLYGAVRGFNIGDWSFNS